jgi:AcrR family transcriptional regulator
VATVSTRSPASRRRSDGERTHTAILEIATRVASVEGIHGLTIGRLAQALGVSKSGLYAHFGSKEQLQLETIAAAQAIFNDEVMRPALEAAKGLPRVEVLCDAYLSYVEREVFPGGCFFASLLAEMDARSGVIHDHVVAGERKWQSGFVALIREAQRRGEIGHDTDAEQLAFQLRGCLELANYHFVLFRDPKVLALARCAIATTLQQARGSSRKRSSKSS